MWDPVAAAPTHAGIAGVLAGFAVAFLIIYLSPLQGATQVDPRLDPLEDAVVRALMVAFAVLTVAAVEWGGLSGYDTDKTDAATVAVMALACVLLLAAGALLFFAGVAEMVSLILASRTMLRSKEAGKKNPSTAALARHASVLGSARRIYMSLALLAAWEIVYFLGQAVASTLGLQTDDFSDLLAVFVIAVLVAIARHVARRVGLMPALLRFRELRPTSRVTTWLNSRRLAALAAGFAAATAALVPDVDPSSASLAAGIRWFVTDVAAVLALAATALMMVGTLWAMGLHAESSLKTLGKKSRVTGKAWLVRKVETWFSPSSTAAP